MKQLVRDAVRLSVVLLNRGLGLVARAEMFEGGPYGNIYNYQFVRSGAR